MKNQSIENETVVRFSSKGLSSEEYEDKVVDVDKYEGKLATVDSLETYTELGCKDYEYYNITFEDGTKWVGISGYHLELIKKATE